MPRVSVILPTNGLAEIIGASIGSVLDQTLQDFELIVVGDGCEDATSDVVAGFDGPRVTWLDRPKAPGSGYANRNIALAQAQGEIIAYAQHDDLWFPRHLEQMVAPFRAPGVEFVHSRPLWIGNDGLLMPYFVNLTHDRMQQAYLERENTVPSSNVAHLRSVLDRETGFDEALLRDGDVDFWRRIIRGNRSGVRCVRPATGLHFRAPWRTGDRWGPPRLQLLQQIAGGHGWPNSLRLPTDSDGPPLQHQVYAALKADPAGFVARLQWGIDQLQDALAWAATQHPLEP